MYHGEIKLSIVNSNALLYVVVRLLLNGGTFFDHLFSLYGILTLICMPIAFVAYYYDKEKKKSEK